MNSIKKLSLVLLLSSPLLAQEPVVDSVKASVVMTGEVVLPSVQAKSEEVVTSQNDNVVERPTSDLISEGVKQNESAEEVIKSSDDLERALLLEEFRQIYDLIIRVINKIPFEVITKDISLEELRGILEDPTKESSINALRIFLGEDVITSGDWKELKELVLEENTDVFESSATNDDSVKLGELVVTEEVATQGSDELEKIAEQE